ncbi:MAG: hypothetical protein AAF560_04505 [Acidobacteriota bacterium]
MTQPPRETADAMREHQLDLAEDPITALNLVAMAADDWGGLWQPGKGGGRLGLPVIAGLRRGWVAGELTVEEAGEGSRLTFQVDKSEYRVQRPAALTLALAALGALVTVIAPFVPALWGLVPIGILMSIAAWFLVIARLRNSGPEEFFEDLEQRSTE